ncbi:MAG: preprotein translocase subunit YajC, partial [Muribaculaceae bacterium]|nr:preprotein translocase subunit YajC [Muribaculaceae bacterium]
SVITAGGIHGKIRGIKENTVMLEIAPNVKIRIDKGMIYASAQDAKTDSNAVSENNADK